MRRQIPAQTWAASLLRDRSFFGSSGGGVTLSGGGDLIVRVAGYSNHFRNLSRALQDEIIERTEQV